ncbi:hypothetical protein KQX62_12050 [Rhodopseudomonas palustris]|uniref:Bacteriophage tail tape measure C-terminal domain-containing protein n=1 Tax=Rhodopseudomonas palustris TaxID=1076 RepID=A0AAX3DTA6_RHOPL|nr:phage tail tape measure C-terminal domain-containing protein [Rhodopseudomonas palustris]UYO37491.1 hypothetical protein KQX62_12050 [Rhodopseudomonas palustris]
METIRRIEIRGSTTGVDEATQSLKNLTTAQGNVAVVSETTSRATLSAASSLDRLKRQLDSGYSAQQQYTKGEATLQRALAQGLITTTEHAKLSDQLAAKYTTQTGVTAALGKVTQSLNLQMASLAGGMGLTGSVLASFGPLGFAAAVGLGAVQSGISSLSDMAHQLADKAKNIREFSEETGLTVAQFQALRSEAGKFGIDSETLSAGVAKFSASFNELRLGSGSLLTDIRKISPALADQMQRTNDAASALTLFGQAIQKTDDIFQRNALLKAAFGKGGASYGAFFQAGQDVKALGDAFVAAGKGLDENLIKKLAQLEIDIAKAKSATQSTFASIFGTSTLEGEKRFNEGVLELTKYAKEFVLSNDLHKLIDYQVGVNAGTALKAGGGALAGAAMGAAGGAAIGALGGGVGAVPGAIAGAVAGAIAAVLADKINEEISSIAPGSLVRGSSPSAPSAVPSWANSQGASWRSSSPPLVPKTQEADAKDLAARVQVLGAAATPIEQLNARLAELSIKAKEAGVSEDVLARAQNALRESFKVDQLQATISALGAAATPAEQLALRFAQLRQQYDQGRISRETLTRAEAAAVLATEKSVASAREQLGILTQREMVEIHLKDVADAEAKGYIRNAEEKMAAEVLFQKSLRDTMERQQVALSSLPQLKQLELDSGNLMKQLDTTAVSALGSIEGSLVDMTMGTKPASDGFKDMATNIVRALDTMIIKMMIIQPIAKSLQSTLSELGGFGGLLGSNSSAGGTVMVGNYAMPTIGYSAGYHTGGIVGSEPTFSRYVHPAYFDDAPRFHSGGIAGDEVPIIARRGEGVFTQGQMAAMGGGSRAAQVTINNYTDASPTVTRNANGDITVTLRKAVDSAVGDSLSAGTGQRVLARQYGVKPFYGQ